MKKTKFFVIDGVEEDKQPLDVEGLAVEARQQYVYLGSPFTVDGSATSAIRVQAQNKMCHTLKFISFIEKNNDIPFIVKRKVFEAALTSTLLYSFESWLNGDVKPVHKQYMWCIKQLLGVRKTTSNDLCLLELGCPPLQFLVKQRQGKFFSEMWRERSDREDDPLAHAFRVTLNHRSPTSHYVHDLIHSDVDELHLKAKVSMSVSGRMLMYITINPHRSVHDIYTSKIDVNELERVSWTRLRVSGHSLAVEEVRWNRRGRGRLPMEERLCSCGQVQTERHVIEHCPRTTALHQQHNITTIENLFIERKDYNTVCNICHTVPV